jgi:hypothetical protein
MRRKTLLILCGIVITSLSGCGIQKASNIEHAANNETPAAIETTVEETSEAQNEESSIEESSIEDEVDISLTKSEQVGYDFIKAIQSGDYEKALSLVDVDDTFINVDDFAWFIPRSDYSDLVDTSYKLTEVESKGDNTSNSTNYILGDLTVNVKTILNNDNEWKVVFNSNLITNYDIKVAKGLGLAINGIEVSDEYLTDDKTEDTETYTIPALIPQKDIKVTLTSKTFGTYDVTLTPIQDEVGNPVFEITGDTRDELYSATKTVLDSINEAYENDAATSEDLAVYVSDKASSDIADTLAQSVKTEYTWNSGMKPTNIRFVTFLPISQDRATEKNTYICYLQANDTVLLNCKIEKSWFESYDKSTESCRMYSKIVVEKTDDGVKIVDIKASDNMITERNSLTSDWK